VCCCARRLRGRAASVAAGLIEPPSSACELLRSSGSRRRKSAEHAARCRASCRGLDAAGAGWLPRQHMPHHSTRALTGAHASGRQGSREARMRGRLAGQLAFTAGEDALLARALLRFGPDLERARLYLLPARARAELEHRVRTRAHARAGDNGIKARPPLGARPQVGTWLGWRSGGAQNLGSSALPECVARAVQKKRPRPHAGHGQGPGQQRRPAMSAAAEDRLLEVLQGWCDCSLAVATHAACAKSPRHPPADAGYSALHTAPTVLAPSGGRAADRGPACRRPMSASRAPSRRWRRRRWRRRCAGCPRAPTPGPPSAGACCRTAGRRRRRCSGPRARRPAPEERRRGWVRACGAPSCTCLTPCPVKRYN